MLLAPINWQTVYDAIYNWAYGATAWTTRWADQDEPRPDFPYILLDITNSKKEGGVAEVREETDATRARNVKVTPIPQNSTTYTVTINGTAFAYTSDATATIAEITAGLVAAINGGSENVSALDRGTFFNIVGDYEVLNPTVHGLFTIIVTDDYDSAQIDWVNNDEGSEISFTTSYQMEFTLNVQAFQRNTRSTNAASNPTMNAYNALAILQACLGLPSVQKALRDEGIAVIQELPILDLSEIVEDSVLSRATMDVRMRTVVELTEYKGFIATVSGEGVLELPGGSSTTESFTSD